MSWIYGNRYLNPSEMRNNAFIVYQYLTGRGWSKSAIAGLLGNMESESTINPGIWQSLDSTNISGGYGLVQWTPSTNYTNWANANGYSITDGDAQLLWIDTQTTPKGQWIATDSYPMTFAEFKTSSQMPEYLASAFLKNFERAGVEVEAERRAQARSWFEFITGIQEGEDPTFPDIPTPNPTPATKKKRKGYNFIIFGRRNRNAY